MAIGISGEVSGNKAEVNTDGTLKVAPTQTPNDAGMIIGGGESGASSDPAGRLARPTEVSGDYRLRTGRDTCVYNRFLANYTVMPPDVRTTSNAMTQSLGGSGVPVVLNSGNSVTANAYTYLATWQMFRVPIAGGISGESVFKWNAAESNSTWFFGFINQSSALTSDVEDGVYLFRASDGTLRLANSRNSSVTMSDVIDETNIAVDARHHVQLVVNTTSAQCWCDGSLIATITFPADSNGVGFGNTNAFHLAIGMFNQGAVSAPVQVSIYNWGVSLLDYDYQKPFSHIQAAGEMAFPAEPRQYNATGRSTFQITNSAAFVGAISLSNTTPPITTLGSNFFFNAPAGANTDYAIIGHPISSGDGLGTKTSVAHGALITGVRLDTVNMGAAVATTPTVIAWYLGIGCTAASLATVDNVGFNRQPIRVPIGMQSFVVGDVIGKQAIPIEIDFGDNPYFCPPHTYFHLIAKVLVGTATGSQTIYCSFTPRGYYL